MFGMSFMELAIIAVLALILLGPEQLPGVAKQLGKGLRALKGVADGVRAEVASEVKLGGEAGEGAQAALEALREVRKVAEDATALLRGEEPVREPPARRKASRAEPAGVVPAGTAGPSLAEAAPPGTAAQAPAEPAPPPSWRQVSLADAAAGMSEPTDPRAAARAPAPAQPADPDPPAAPTSAGADVPEG